MNLDKNGSLAENVIAAFERCAAARPTAIALVCEHQRLTYDELNRHANALAARIAEAPVGPGSRVALCLPRSPESIVGTLAALKLGAAYVPIDPNYPDDYIAHLLRDSSAAILLTSGGLRQRVAPLAARVMVLDECTTAAADFSQNPARDLQPSSPACLMYTSGTTGTPKGVPVPHGGICTLLQPQEYICVGSQDIVLHHSTCSFDAAVFEIWAALLNGATLVLSLYKHFDLDALHQIIARERVTTLLLTTSLFHLVAEQKPECFDALRHLFVGGDVMYAKAAIRALTGRPHLRLVNGYGPTENAVFTCCHVLTAPEAVQDPVPIGKPILGRHVYILNECRQPVPVGEVGELHTNGAGLAAGYINRPEETARAFVHAPFVGHGVTLYRTGDLARQDAEGNLHFIGRKDHQVKIRGYRVEPAQIENVLCRHPDVEECVVLIESGHAGDKHLIAFARVPQITPASRPRALRNFLAAALPPFMVPSSVHVRAQFPLTLNGKIDRRRLLDSIKEGKAEVAAATAAAIGPDGDLVLAVWQDALKSPALSPDDTIYDAGATSLTIILVHHELNRRLACSLPVDAVMQAGTPREWAQIYENWLDNKTTGIIS